MQDKKTFREVFNFFVKYREQMGLMSQEAFWSSAAEEMGRLCAELGNTDLAMDMFIAVYLELERRDAANERQAQGQCRGA